MSCINPHLMFLAFGLGVLFSGLLFRWLVRHQRSTSMARELSGSISMIGLSLVLAGLVTIIVWAMSGFSCTA